MKFGLCMVESPAPAPYLSTMKTVLITGCSSGYGLETARHFLAQGWNVVWIGVRGGMEERLISPRGYAMSWVRFSNPAMSSKRRKVFASIE